MVRKAKASAAANVVAARERAQQLAMAPMARQQRLVDRATDFFLATERQDLAREEGERKIREIRERVVEQVEAARVEAGAAVVAMMGEDEPVGAVAERLGLRRVDVQELRRLVRAQEPEREPVREPGARGGVARSAAGPGAGPGGGAAVVASDAGDGGAAGGGAEDARGPGAGAV
ncbi:hypothetical protein [Streptomyces sp. S1D4-20]|uniref:hypothetical protein n=1 Tax=Streptomyces sp. S1D4-20 TaxID=2594462 RepID=UPI001162910E|nr:hypothetical protein [Streptomyces sp. S1D4-20]QDN54046.1 hypothetical protein FNV67_00250 [Streptomyces sp. S1D4-20]